MKTVPWAIVLIASRKPLNVPINLLSLLPVLVNRIEAELIRLHQARCLDAARDELQRIQSLASLGSWVMDIQSRYLECSRQALSLFDLMSHPQPPLFDELLGKLLPEDKPVLQRLTENVIRNHQVYTCLVRLQPEGRRRPGIYRFRQNR